MNEQVCKLCKRYTKSNGMYKGWVCARFVHKVESNVIPGFLYYKKDGLHPITTDMKIPPDWCDRPLEQVILAPEDDVNIQKDVQMSLEFDGNKNAENHLKNGHGRYNGPLVTGIIQWPNTIGLL